jgi:hypothetical protein
MTKKMKIIITLVVFLFLVFTISLYLVKKDGNKKSELLLVQKKIGEEIQQLSIKEKKLDEEIQHLKLKITDINIRLPLEEEKERKKQYNHLIKKQKEVLLVINKKNALIRQQIVEIYDDILNNISKTDLEIQKKKVIIDNPKKYTNDEFKNAEKEIEVLEKKMLKHQNNKKTFESVIKKYNIQL